PSRSKISCALTCNTTYKSPGGPPRTPASPFPEERNRDPVSTPAGIFNLIFEVRSRRPLPWQILHGRSTIFPRPSQRGHVWAMLKIPREFTTCPRPPQVAHVLVVAPFSAPVLSQASHASAFVMEISFSQPSAASTKL